jgi:hypothetical protein
MRTGRMARCHLPETRKRRSGELRDLITSRPCRMSRGTLRAAGGENAGKVVRQMHLRRSEACRRISVKPSAKPTLVRTQHLPPPAETAPGLRIRGRGRVLSAPGSSRWALAVDGRSRNHGETRSPGSLVAERVIYPGIPELFVTIDASGVDAEQHCDAMSGAARDFGCRYACVESQRHPAVP